MRYGDVRKLRERQEWSQNQLAELLNGALNRAYTGSVVSAWERNARPIPDEVSKFLDSLALESGLTSPDERVEDGGAPAASPDTAPGPDTLAGDRPGVPPLRGNAYGKACAELFGILGTTVASMGALAGSEAVKNDGYIILHDKDDLGRVWGHLAETNETFRSWLVAAHSGGAYFEIALVTGQAVGAMMTNHAQVGARKREEAGLNGSDGVPVYGEQPV